MSVYCEICKKVVIPEEYIDHQDCCTCSEEYKLSVSSESTGPEFYAYLQGNSNSCMEATLLRSLPPRTLKWSGRIDSAANLLLTASYFKYDFNIQGSFLYIFDRSQGGQIIEECWEPKVFGQILRKYIDDADNEHAKWVVTTSGDKK